MVLLLGLDRFVDRRVVLWHNTLDTPASCFEEKKKNARSKIEHSLVIDCEV